MQDMNIGKVSKLIKTCLLFLFLLLIILSVNSPIISFDMMYPEQPTIYLANQTIVHFSDLLNIYLHPTWLHTNIPFFRPTGHFLFYQLLVPLFGWHSTKAFIITNFIFLALTCALLIKVYQLLFPPYKLGSYIACSFYLMHPALSISRLTVMHFEFAYIFFSIASLYCFILFCQKNKMADTSIKQRYCNFSLLICSLFNFVIAVTCKEPAIMLGPVLFCFFCTYSYQLQSLPKRIFFIFLNPYKREILLLLIALTLALSWYLMLAWPALGQASKNVNFQNSIGTFNAFLIDIFGLKHNYLTFGSLPFQQSAWRTIAFPSLARYIVWELCWISLFCIFIIYKSKVFAVRAYKHSIVFLFLSACLFMLLPLLWGMGAPWHHSLTLLCLSLIMGFSVEFVCHSIIKNPRICIAFYFSIVLLMLASTVMVNQANIRKYLISKEGSFGLTLNRNAVLYPPNIKHKLKADSLILVEDSTLHNDYLLGNSAYPFLLLLNKEDFNTINDHQQNFFIKFHHTYSGTLFRYAYLMPSLKEEVYPFQIEKMHEVPNEIIYSWLIHYENIFCLGYDANANWHDKTDAFKQRLLKEKVMRKLSVHHFIATPYQSIPSHALYSKVLTISDHQLCQFTCDQDNSCHRYIYKSGECYFYR